MIELKNKLVVQEISRYGKPALVIVNGVPLHNVTVRRDADGLTLTVKHYIFTSDVETPDAPVKRRPEPVFL